METLEKPTWVKMDEKELKKIIAELSEKNSAPKIGLILRDQYGIPTTKIFGKKLKAYLREMNLDKNEELESIEKKVGRMKEHLKTNITDKKTKHKLQKAQSQLNTTKKYFDSKKNI